MLKRFEVKNYKNFKDKISIDFSRVGGYRFSDECISGNMIGKMLIYGKNATGKTNLGSAVSDIGNILFPFRSAEKKAFLNADSTEKFAEFTYLFQFDDDEVCYMYKKKDDNIISYEELLINGEVYFSNHILDDGRVFTPGKALREENINCDRYTDVYEESDMNERKILPFLRWIIYNTALEEESVLMKLYNFVKGMFFVSINNTQYRGVRSLIMDEFFNSLEKEEKLKDFEEFLNVMGVECRLELQRLPDDTVELYFKHNRRVPFLQTASSGTIALMRIYQMLYPNKNVSFMYIDEFDAFYHYEMSENMIQYLKVKYPNSQIILTTHNTNLMTNSIMRPDCLFILSTYGTLTPLCDATQRELREGHNLEKLYISGEFKAYE